MALATPATNTPANCEDTRRWWEKHGPVRVMFLNTTLELGGAEVLLLELVKRLGHRWLVPEVVCLKQPGELAPQFSAYAPVHARLLAHKYDLRVLYRLVRLFRQRRADVVVSVGAGDKMFWGRLAAWWAQVPVALVALHSTGWPDRIHWLNRQLDWCTHGYIAVAEAHRRFLIHKEKLPAGKVFVIPNAVDTARFCPGPAPPGLREQLGLDAQGPVVGIVAALRPEKNHEGFLRVARTVLDRMPQVQFLIVGDGPRRQCLQQLARELKVDHRVWFLGSRGDVPQLLRLMDLVMLTSHVEAAPVTILEAMATGRPFVAPAVGSIGELIVQGQTGLVVPPGDEEALAQAVLMLLGDARLREQMGQAARQRAVRHYSVERMVRGYQRLILRLFCRRRGVPPPPGCESWLHKPQGHDTACSQPPLERKTC